MGIYINPRDMTKEDWLVANATTMQDEAPASHFRAHDKHIAVCLVNNDGFTAAAVCFSERERQVFTHETDLRPKLWFWVPIQTVSDVLGFDLEVEMKMLSERC